MHHGPVSPDIAKGLLVLPDEQVIEKLFPGKGLSRDKFTFQFSDHLPVWVQLKTDIDLFRFDQIVPDGKRP